MSGGCKHPPYLLMSSICKGVEKLNSLYRATGAELERVLQMLTRALPPPRKVPYLDGFVVRYLEKSIEQALVQKLARVPSSLHAIDVLLQAGLLQEQSAIKRMSDEICEDIIFLSLALNKGEVSDLHKQYLESFYEEEFGIPADPKASTQARAMVPRKKIRAYIAQQEEYGTDPSTGVTLGRTISKAYSGYVHAASPQIMEMYGGHPPRFLSQIPRDSQLYQDAANDSWNYLYRSVIAFGMAAVALRHNVARDEVFAAKAKLEHSVDQLR